ncbi:MAG: hypothetical protein CL878_14440 [Dehalococcoidia bacterium]|nr:hypothetical protein [Dehalococcoidia bacterium]
MLSALARPISASSSNGWPRTPILQVSLQTGVRVSELCALTMEDLDFERWQVTVHGKGQAERTIPLN